MSAMNHRTIMHVFREATQTPWSDGVKSDRMLHAVIDAAQYMKAI
jgi:hypothetical protein